MWSFLALAVHACPGLLNESGRVAQRAIVVNRKRRDTAALIIRGEQPFAGAIERNVTRPGPSGGNLVERRERAGVFDGVRAQRALTILVRGVKKVSLDGKKRGIRRFSRHLGQR